VDTTLDSVMATFFRIIRILWVVVRFPALALLAICEPLVSFGLTSLALLGVLVAAFYACVLPFQAIPVFGLLAGAVGMILLLVVYYALVRVLSG
jgi:hypothetical protein